MHYRLLYQYTEHFFLIFQYLFIYNINKLDGGKTSTEAPRFSPHLGCQGLPGLDINEILINRSKYSYIAVNRIVSKYSYITVSIIEHNSSMKRLYKGNHDNIFYVIEQFYIEHFGFYVQIYTYIYLHTHTHIYTYIHIYTNTYTHIHTQSHVHIHTHTHIYIYAYIHTSTHTYTYAYT